MRTTALIAGMLVGFAAHARAGEPLDSRKPVRLLVTRGPASVRVNGAERRGPFIAYEELAGAVVEVAITAE